ncbi:helix-turn-helix domain-containing protein [Cupriavidus gilardii]|uniref:carph-isopro domain-containing protein n=1 Tax=Cupriavidus gilardii TaxID=82541 RepID=UPI001ABE3EED|nr:YdaS family helix-turn-helix protein [Cupriavidus gilardii]MBO4120257.1 helix-turn-helix domain-containing protein [Cupriavidus gilardii]
MATADQLIDLLGGTSAVAELLGIKAPSVSDWRKTGIPRSRVSELALASGKKPKSLDDLAPDRWHLIWPELGQADTAVAAGGRLTRRTTRRPARGA